MSIDGWRANASLHLAYPYLSETHRADYPPAYLMHHHGGGYADIKVQAESWSKSVEHVNSTKLLIGCGYREIRGGSPCIHQNLINGKAYILDYRSNPFVSKVSAAALRLSYPLRIGNGAFYFKPRTYYTRKWLTLIEARLDILLPDLVKNPAQSPRDRRGSPSGYPVPWSFLLGDITGPLSLLSMPFLARTLPAPEFTDYGANDR